MQAVILPVLGANMTHGVIRAWRKREGDTVVPGEPLFEVETDKVNAEVEAEQAGILRRIVAPEGTRVAVLGVVAFVGAAEEPVPAPETWAAHTPAGIPAVTPASPMTATAATESVSDGSGKVTASPAARRLARERGVNLDQLRGSGARGEITRADVEAAALRVVTPGGSGRMDPAFLALLRRDGTAVRALSSESKIELYRRHGAQIGERVRIDPGAIIVAEEIRIGAAAAIGADTTIECERFQLGRLSVLGKRTRVHCRTVEIGDALWSKDDVVIGGGGSNEAGAHLKAGDACFFGEAAYLNPCHPVTLGDEVCVGSRAMLFTHSHWQSILQGYASLFGPITIGDHVFIGNQAFVFPGVTLGAGVTVMVNSFVAVNVAANTLVGGVPAQVVRHVVAPSRAEQVRIMRERFPELAAALAERGYRVSSGGDDERIVLDIDDGSAVCFTPDWPAPGGMPKRRRLVVLAFGDGGEPRCDEGVTLFDLRDSRVFGPQDRLSDEVREFCRRRGIRFRPLAWRCGVGHCEGDRFVPRGA